MDLPKIGIYFLFFYDNIIKMFPTKIYYNYYVGPYGNWLMAIICF